MSIKETMRAAAETIRPPSLQELKQRLEQARQALVSAQSVHDAAQAALEGAYVGDDDGVTLKAQSDLSQARLALERAAGRVAAIERQATGAEALTAADSLAAGLKVLAEQIKARSRAGEQIVAALDALAAGVAAFDAADSAIIALPASIRGINAVPGHNFGPGPLRAHLSIELAQRSIVGEPSSLAVPGLADWLALGNRTLKAASE